MFTVRFLPERLFSSGNTSVGPRVRDLGRTHAEPVVSALLGVGAGGTSGSDGCTCSGEEIARVLLLQVIDNERGANAVTVTPALHPAPGWVSSPSCWKDEDTGPTGTCLAQLHVPVQRGADLGGRASRRAAPGPCSAHRSGWEPRPEAGVQPWARTPRARSLPSVRS